MHAVLQKTGLRRRVGQYMVAGLGLAVGVKAKTFRCPRTVAQAADTGNNGNMCNRAYCCISALRTDIMPSLPDLTTITPVRRTLLCASMWAAAAAFLLRATVIRPVPSSKT